MSNSGVYQVRNIKTGHRYIGSSSNLRNRESKHWCDLRKGKHPNSRLQAAWDADGASAFVFEVLEVVAGRRQLIRSEQNHMDSATPEYNIAPMAGTSTGLRPSAEARRKMSASRSGERNVWFGVCGENNPLHGRKQPAHLKALWSEMRKGKNNPMHGVTPTHAKLSVDQVRQVRSLLSDGQKMRLIAEKFGVSIGAVSHIKHGRSYVGTV